jgi:Asp-tRNA(Asn)/Glu-tRNA(Gln) amidotransferase A subunit family amidase
MPRSFQVLALLPLALAACAHAQSPARSFNVVGATIADPAFGEAALIRYAYDFEQTTRQRKDPPLFPALP